jgi:hypothetical protein
MDHQVPVKVWQKFSNKDKKKTLHFKIHEVINIFAGLKNFHSCVKNLIIIRVYKNGDKIDFSNFYQFP